MDIESDDSERWEDFFGSSTDLAPSLLGIYDSLTSQFDGGVSTFSDGVVNNNNSDTSSSSNNISSDNSTSDNCSSVNNTSDHSTSDSSNTSLSNEYTLHHSVEVEEYEAEENVVELDVYAGSLQADSHSSRDSSLTLAAVGNNNNSPYTSLSSLSPTNSSNSSNKSRDSPAKHRNNIRVLSPNVQRIITHSDAEPIEAIDIGALQQQQSTPLLSPLSQQRFAKRQTTVAPLHGGHKVKLSHIPLSKITGKLTQSGSDLVETFDSSCEYLDALSFSHSERSNNRKPLTPAIVPIPGSVDDEKTPTNSVSTFNFDPSATLNKSRKLTLPKQESLKLIEMEQMHSEQQQQQQKELKNTISTQPASSIAKEFVATAPLDACEMVEAINLSLVSQGIEQLGFGDHQEGSSAESINNVNSSSTELIEAINRPLISKPLVRSVSAACASTIAGSPLLTYARSKSLAAKANTLGGAVPIKLPTAEQLAELEEASQLSAESLDRLMDIKSKFSPKESRKMSGLILPDIAKLKHRPLSSSSICSTSSSSSSGSDHLNGKLMTTSYLASVESLADQSENELLDPHHGMSVFERACMEIVDSERSFVEDLGQVIRGYLLDWKERACLRYDELRILFANIEEIYDFNSTLLKQLINSGMDPVKIAKCFIDLRERFDVYTTYCTSYPEAISLLTRLLQATHTNSLLTSTQKMLQHTLPLGSYLLKPVQRILKYHLLLDNLRKHCDVKEVFQAHEIMRQVARNIDQVKRKLEQQSRVKELSGILDGWLGPELTVLGELRQEGLLLEHSKPRMVFLFGTMLIITKPKEDNRLQFKSYIHQNNLMLSEHLPGEPTSFYVIPYDEPRNQIKLTAKNRDQKRLWAQHIKGAILEKFDNIPSRAKELVYKLGDEEDRTPDRNIWKWSLHSTSTPVYLERRNQYRRSEMRNRSKMKRKTVTNSSSFESFNEAAESNLETGQQSLSRNNSMDDSMIPALQKLVSAVKTGKSEEDCSCENAPNCACILRTQRNSIAKSPFFCGKALKERSKSVPRISFQSEEFDADDAGRDSLHGSNTNLDSRKSKSSKSVEVKQYSTKMMPKRIATMKKQRSSKKETSKFYMDLSEFESNTQTVLKITESSENLVGPSDSTSKYEEETNLETHDHPVDQVEDVVQKPDAEDVLTPAEKAKKDARIILELLKNNKEFERLGKKPQKKRTLESSASAPTSPETLSIECDSPPRPPSRSPPPLDSESDTRKKPADDEHIYESLLRNVHVPYKFSPVLGRCNSTTQYYKPREKPPQPRPESDYVTLVYSPEGTLQQVGEDAVHRVPSESKINGETAAAPEQRDSNSSSSSSSSTTSSNACSSSSCSTLKRSSQSTVISVDLGASSGYLSQMSASTPEAIYARPMPKNLMKRLLSSTSKNSMENVSTSEISLPPRGRKSIECLALSFARSSKPPERRVSDVTEMCRQSIIHRQGSESVGERMAHVDYADPRTLFSMMNSSDGSSLQRDSAFSLTSSNDSVCDAKRNGSKSEKVNGFDYEENVEASLENDFRDSAIYSDDNEKRPNSEYIKRPSSPPPPPPPARNRNPPQVPPKPATVPKSPVRQMMSSLDKVNGMSDGGVGGGVGGTTGSVITGGTQVSQSASRSWVLQQIENFNK